MSYICSYYFDFEERTINWVSWKFKKTRIIYTRIEKSKLLIKMGPNELGKLDTIGSI